MLVKTKGIVLHQLKYSETSIIAKVFTFDYGIQSYLAKGARSRKSKISPALFQALSLVEIVAYRKEKSSLHHLKEIKSLHHFQSICVDIVKSSIGIFINELLYRSIKEEEPNPALFEFIFNSVMWFDLAEEKFANFHLVFAIQLTKYLGFYPSGSNSKSTPIFNLIEGMFDCKLNCVHEHIDENGSSILDQILKLSYENMHQLKINGEMRAEISEKIIRYYHHHLPTFDNIKSLEVLKTVLS